MRLLRGLHTAYGSLIFLLLFIIFFFPLLVPILFPRKFSWVGILNRWWAKLLFIFVVLPYKVECRARLDKKKQYIFCPNHFSYIDIPTMGLNPVNTIFVGKNDIERVPFFGFMYGKLHISVDRKKLRSKAETIIKSRQAIDEGKSLVLYPEGGVYSRNAPEMVSFKDGAFRLAIEKQIAVVPVTIPFNWIILPGDEFLLRQGNIQVIFHEPIETRGMTLDDVDRLKEQVFKTIETELRIKNENRPTTSR